MAKKKLDPPHRENNLGTDTGLSEYVRLLRITEIMVPLDYDEEWCSQLMEYMDYLWADHLSEQDRIFAIKHAKERKESME